MRSVHISGGIDGVGGVVVVLLFDFFLIGKLDEGVWQICLERGWNDLSGISNRADN